MDRKLFSKVVQRIKTVGIIEAFLVFPVAAFDLTVVSGSVGTDELVANPQFGSSQFKSGGNVPLTVCETIGKFKAIIGLDTLYGDASAFIPNNEPLQKIRRGIGGLLGVSGQKAQAGKFINRSVLE